MSHCNALDDWEYSDESLQCVGRLGVFRSVTAMHWTTGSLQISHCNVLDDWESSDESLQCIGRLRVFR